MIPISFWFFLVFLSGIALLVAARFGRVGGNVKRVMYVASWTGIVLPLAVLVILALLSPEM